MKLFLNVPVDHLNRLKTFPKSKDHAIEHVPEALFPLLDMSCMIGGITRAPEINNGRVLRYGRKSVTGKSDPLITKYTLVALYQCHDGFEFATAHEKMYCSRRSWIGEAPRCEVASSTGKSRARGSCVVNVEFVAFVELTSTQSDGASVTSPSGGSYTDECPLEFRLTCQHNCTVVDEKSVCVCYGGFEMIEGDCRGTFLNSPNGLTSDAGNLLPRHQRM